MAKSFTLHRATVEDIDTLIEFRDVMWREAAGNEGSDNMEDTLHADEALDRAREYFETSLPSGEYVCFLARAQGRVVGIGGMYLAHPPPWPRSPRGVEGYILNMYTLPQWRRIGIASTITRELLACARNAGATMAALRASDDGRRIYERLGFREVTHYMRAEL